MAINQDMKAIVLLPKLGPDFLFYSLEALRDNLVKRFGRSGNGTRTGNVPLRGVKPEARMP
jgi:hypothetical protein